MCAPALSQMHSAEVLGLFLGAIKDKYASPGVHQTSWWSPHAENSPSPVDIVLHLYKIDSHDGTVYRCRTPALNAPDTIPSSRNNGYRKSVSTCLKHPYRYTGALWGSWRSSRSNCWTPTSDHFSVHRIFCDTAPFLSSPMYPCFKLLVQLLLYVEGSSAQPTTAKSPAFDSHRPRTIMQNPRSRTTLYCE